MVLGRATRANNRVTIDSEGKMVKVVLCNASAVHNNGQKSSSQVVEQRRMVLEGELDRSP